MGEAHMNATFYVYVYHDDGSFSGYLKRGIDVPRIPVKGDKINIEGMRLPVWATGDQPRNGDECLIAFRVNPAEVRPLTAQRKLISSGFQLSSARRRRIG